MKQRILGVLFLSAATANLACGAGDATPGSSGAEDEARMSEALEGDSPSAGALLTELQATYTRAAPAPSPRQAAMAAMAASASALSSAGLGLRQLSREPVVADNPDVGWGRTHDGARLAKTAGGPSEAAEVRMMGTSAEGFELRDVRTGMTARVRMAGIKDVPLETARGVALFRGVGAAPSNHWLLRAQKEGVEDYLTFETAPERTAVDYDVDLTSGVAGVRFVERTFELLDSGGAPRLRMSPPHLVDAVGQRVPAEVSVTGCLYDDNPSAPWGRAPIAPNSASCRVRITWNSGVNYPAALDPSWSTTQSMAQARAGHTASLLFTGYVLVTGSGTASELYNSKTKTWAATGSLNVDRTSHTANTLPSGDVLVTGGYTTGTFNSTEIYRPVTGRWTLKASLRTGRAAHTSIVLADGRLLVTGGLNRSFVYLKSAEIYDPDTNVWTPGLPMHVPRLGHWLSLLPDARVLATGGSTSGGVYTSAVDIYNPAMRRWTATSPMREARAFHTASKLEDGRILVTGGYGAGFLGTAEIFYPTIQAWDYMPVSISPRDGHTATHLANGNIVIVGGSSSTSRLNSGYRFRRNGTWADDAPLLTARTEHTATALPTGGVLVTGGFTGPTGTYTATSNVELYADGDPTGGECPGGALIRASVTTPPSSVNLSAEGSAGWAHWGLPTSTSYNTGRGNAPISKVTPSPGTFVSTEPSGGPTFSWVGGSPTPQATTTSGLIIYGDATLSAAASGGMQRLKIYLGAPGPTQVLLSLPGTTCGTRTVSIDSPNVELDVDYAGSASGQRLQMSLPSGSGHNGSGRRYLYLRAATLVSQAPPLQTLLRITGDDLGTASGLQSETSIATSGGYGIVVAYNDELDNDPTIVQTPTSRTVYRGASLMGWSWAPDSSGPWVHKRLTPPTFWPVLWGDPATVVSRANRTIVYMSNLAAPEAKFAKAANASGGVVGSLRQAIGGACIARSPDAGRSFELVMCATNQNKFWDGGSMESDLNGTIYAGYWALDDKKIDIIRFDAIASGYSLLPRPFGSLVIGSHVRLRYDVISRRLYAAALESTGDLWATYWDGSSWSNPVQIGQSEWDFDVYFGSTRVRGGVPFSFDVAASQSFDKVARFVFVRPGSPHQLDTVFCSPELSNCAKSTYNLNVPGEEAFQPVIRGTTPGIGEWLVSWYARTGDTVKRRIALLPADATLPPRPYNSSVPAHTPCPATTSGYWSDYEDIQPFRLGWLLTTTDSRPSCTRKWPFLSNPVHVQSDFVENNQVLFDTGTRLNPVHED